MLNEIPILTILTFFPLFCSIFIAAVKGDKETINQNARVVALWSSILTFIISLVLIYNFDFATPGYQFEELRTWDSQLKITYHLGVDGISILFILLTTFLTPLCILTSWKTIKRRTREYMIMFLLMETLIIGMFCALDLVLFYIFFEGVLIPMFVIIGIWGGERRIYSTFKFFLYTLLGSLFMLLAIIMMYIEVGTTNLTTILAHDFTANQQYWFWLAFFFSFAVKVPMWPVHTWLPDAHVEAPTAGSVMLAAVLLKMGGYGLLRFSLPLFPIASTYFAPFVMTLSVIAIIYASLVALVQKDIKKLIAYSSIAHMGFVTLGIFSLTLQAVSGSILQMISHGFVSAALFLCVGVLYDRLHTRDIERFGGLVKVMPLYSLLFMIFTLASVGLPGTSGFVGEFLVILGTFQTSSIFATLATLGIILGAAYSLWLYRRVVYGKLEHADLKGLPDLNSQERVTLGLLACAVLWMGIYPSYFTNIITPASENIINQLKTSSERQLTRIVAMNDTTP